MKLCSSSWLALIDASLEERRERSLLGCCVAKSFTHINDTLIGIVPVEMALLGLTVVQILSHLSHRQLCPI